MRPTKKELERNPRMKKQKKTIKVRDLKPLKDVKGGRLNTRER
jgi:hypothetical protein